MTSRLRLLYLDDCAIDQRLLRAYLREDAAHTYDVTACTTVEEAETALAGQRYDALILDNRVPPFRTYHEAYARLIEATGFDGSVLVISADPTGEEFHPERRRGAETVLDKADLLATIRSGAFASAVRPGEAAGAWA